MSDAFIIEAAGTTAGIVVRHDRGFRFFASSHPFHRIDGVIYRRPHDAERAARRLIAEETRETRPNRHS